MRMSWCCRAEGGWVPTLVALSVPAEPKICLLLGISLDLQYDSGNGEPTITTRDEHLGECNHFTAGVRR